MAHTDFSAAVADFESDLAGCTEGSVVNGPFRPTHPGRVFIGDKEFTCAGDEPRLHGALSAVRRGRLDRIVERHGRLGDLAGLKGSGSLVGTPTDAGIGTTSTPAPVR